MTQLTLIKTHQNPPPIKQSRIKRDWMDETYNKHVYQCLPLTMANVSGWEVLLEQDVVVQWDGGNTVPKVLEGATYNNRNVTQPSIIGIMSFTLGWAFKTEDGYSTWIGGSPNYFVDGAVPLTASIPSYWWPDEFNMNWKITKVGEPVTFPAGMPFMFFTIYPNELIQNVKVKVENLWDKPKLIEERKNYGDAKMKKNQDEPWTWMKGIKTGLNEKGERIGPLFEGFPKLEEPNNAN